jgi:hypothetical protein
MQNGSRLRAANGATILFAQPSGSRAERYREGKTRSKTRPESKGELYLFRALFEDLFGEVVADLRVVTEHFVVGETEHLGVTLA